MPYSFEHLSSLRECGLGLPLCFVLLQLRVAHEDGRELCAGGIAGRLEAAVLAVDDARTDAPAQRVNSPRADQTCIRPAAEVARRGRVRSLDGLRIALQHERHVLTADLLHRAERAVLEARDDALLLGPGNGLAVPLVRRDVRERVRRADLVAGEAVEDRGDHGAVEGGVRLELALAHTVHEAGLEDIVHALVVPALVRAVGERLGRAVIGVGRDRAGLRRAAAGAAARLLALVEAAGWLCGPPRAPGVGVRCGDLVDVRAVAHTQAGKDGAVGALFIDVAGADADAADGHADRELVEARVRARDVAVDEPFCPELRLFFPCG